MASLASLERNARPQLQCRYRSGMRLELNILEISAGGCMVESLGWSVRPDEDISIKLPGLGYQPATVVWIEDGRAGVAFEEPLYGPMLEHIERLLAA